MRFVTCLGPDGVEEPAVLSADGTAVTPLRWLGLPCDTLTEAIPQLTPAVPPTPLPPSIRTPSTFPSGSPVPCRTAASSRPTPTL